ncbi:MAG: hypothetical protein HQ581_27920 [Planctomycetes bacterium]|nr:hypothetical protein [Planctomycetota bacterium]
MPADDGTEPIADEELLYRRIPAAWYDPDVDPSVALDAFRPRKDDVTGLSICRAKYKSAEEAAASERPGKIYFIAVLRAGDLRRCGMEVVPRPLEGDPGHAEISSLNYRRRRDKNVIEWKKLLAHDLALRVEGPFPS